MPRCLVEGALSDHSLSRSMNENTNQAGDAAQEREQDKPSKKKHASSAEEEGGGGGGGAAAAGNGADDLPTQEKQRSSKKNAPIERVDAAVDGIMSGSPFSELQLSERTQKVKKRFLVCFHFREKRKRSKKDEKNSKKNSKKKTHRRSPPSASRP